MAAPLVIDGAVVPEVPCPKCGQVHPRCAAHKSRGGLAPCGRAAMNGQRVCYVHGGASKQAKREAASRIAADAVQNTAGIYGVPRRVDPAQGLIEEFWRTAGIVAGLEPIVTALTRHELTMGTDSVTDTAGAPNWDNTKDGERETITIGDLDIDIPTRALTPTERKTVMKAGPNVWVRIFNEERDRLHRLGIDIMRLGLEQRRDEYVREQAGVFVDLLNQLSLTPEQRREASRLMKALDRKASE